MAPIFATSDPSSTQRSPDALQDASIVISDPELLRGLENLIRLDPAKIRLPLVRNNSASAPLESSKSASVSPAVVNVVAGVKR